jgi:hypothetical protein
LYHPTPIAPRLKEGQESIEMLQALISIHIAPYMRAAVKRHWLPNYYAEGNGVANWCISYSSSKVALVRSLDGPLSKYFSKLLYAAEHPDNWFMVHFVDILLDRC